MKTYFFTAGISEEFEGKKLYAKVRYSAKPAAVSYEVYDKKIIATFDEPQRAIAPGQSLVFYLDDVVVGGGFIVST